MSGQPKSFYRWLLGITAMATLVALAGLVSKSPAPRGGPGLAGTIRPVALQLLSEPDPLAGGVAWLNTSGPIKFKELRGKIVILDFWTYCCINCHHIMPTLAKIEEKYKNEVVVIGVHTPKFPAEHDNDNLRRKVREYELKHPVINDANQEVWNNLGVNSWPTLMVFGPKGEPLAKQGGEVTFEVLDKYIARVISEHKADIKESPVKFFPENEKPDDTPLLFPGKVLADVPGGRLFVSDTGHNRIVVTNLEGKLPTLIGSGVTGRSDGSFEKAQFNRPQGMDLIGDTLYVADTENHSLRAVDLKAKTVTTIAGTGEQSHRDPRDGSLTEAASTALSSPWDLTHVPGTKVLYVAMAGPHQIWRLDLATGKIGVWAGTGMENIGDGSIARASFAQPSGLTTDGRHLYVADSEGSAVRSITLGEDATVSTLLGQHDVQGVLFSFGDEDGKGQDVRMQHCLGVAWGDGKLYIADTYNNKIKVSEPKTQSVKAFVGTGSEKDFYQPGGLSVAGSKLYVADTNNHRIRVVDLGSDKVETLDIAGLTPPAPKPRKPSFLNAVKIPAPRTEIAAGKELTIDVTLPLPAGYKLNTEGGEMIPVLVETPGKVGLIDTNQYPENGQKVTPSHKLKVKIPFAKLAAGDSFDLKLSVQAFVCNEGSNFCTIKSYVWTVPVTVTEKGSSTVSLGAAVK